jgi:hypothetical protein
LRELPKYTRKLCIRLVPGPNVGLCKGGYRYR